MEVIHRSAGVCRATQGSGHLHVVNSSQPCVHCASQATGRDVKKLADKERRQIEEAHRAKAAALRDDDNVFDVAYEQQGSEGQDVLSATDIKARPDHRRLNLGQRRRTC